MAQPGNSREPEAQSPVSLESLQRELQTLRALVQAIIVVLIVLSGSVDIFIWKQVITVRHEIDERRKFVEDYEKNGVPLMNDFVTKLQAFTKTNADFAPILMKYLRLLSPPATAPRQATTNK